MPFGPLPKDTNFYIVNFLLIAAYILYAFIASKTKGKSFVGIRYSGSLLDLDPEIRKKVNRRFAILDCSFLLPLLIANTIFFILKYPISFPGTILVIFAIGMITISSYIGIYADNLTRKKQIEGQEVKRAKIPLYAIIILIVLVILSGIVLHLIFR